MGLRTCCITSDHPATGATIVMRKCASGTVHVVVVNCLCGGGLSFGVLLPSLHSANLDNKGTVRVK